MSTEKRTKLLPWIAVLAVTGLMAFIAIPVLAAPSGTKYYLFAVSPSGAANPVNTGTTQNFTVTVTNTSPKQSSSNISSVSILVPTQFTINGTPTITSASTNGDNSSAVVAVNGPNSVGCTAGTGQKVSVCSIAPVKSQKKVVISIATTVGAAGLACGQSAPSDAWIVKANTGSQLNGNDFDPDPTQPSPITTTIQHVCNASIAGQIWRDHNQNGAKDPTFESVQTGWTISAYEGTSSAGTVTYPSAGHYKISNLEAGHTYTVCETAPAEDPQFLYRGWFQEDPTDPDFPSAVASTTTCSASGTEPTGYSVTPPASSPDVTGVDFFNARAIEVTTCGTTYSVGGDNSGDPSGSVTMPDTCKTGTYVFESWVNPDGTQETDFYPVHITGGTGSTQVTQSITWPLSNKGQATLQYDDDPSNPPGFQPVLFCDVDSQGHFTGMPVDEQPGATTCLMHTDETPTSGGVIRHDTIISFVDGKLRTSY